MEASPGGMSLLKILGVCLAGGVSLSWNPVPDLDLFIFEAIVAD